jgi:hypothetical protein
MKPIYKIVLFLFWAVLLLTGYYYYHKPVLPDQIVQFFSSIYDLIISALILLVCAGLGRKLIRIQSTNSLADLAMQAALGAGVAGLAWLGLGETGLFHWWAAGLITILGLVFLRKEIRAWLQDWHGWIDIWRGCDRVGRWFIALALLLALNQLWVALAPPIKYDALTYHLALPKIYLSQGILVFTPENPYWGHPQLVEMLYTWAAALGRSSTAAAFSWWAGVICLTGLAGFTSQHFPSLTATHQQKSTAAAATVAFVLVGASARLMLGWAYTDLFSAWFGLALLQAFFCWLDTGDSRWLLWGGVFAGMAVSTKYTAGIAAIVFFGGVWVIRGIRRLPVRSWVISAGLALMVFLPWALKNTFTTGNPLFPYLVPTQWYSADRLASANLPPEGYQTFPQLVLPIYLTWAGVDSAPGPGTDLGPLLILFALPALFAYRNQPKIRFLGLSLAVAWMCISLAGWRFGHLQQPRLYFVLLPALAVLSGWGWASVQAVTASGVRLGRIATAIAGIVLILAVWQDVSNTLVSGAIQTVLGLQSREAYVENNTGAYFTAMQALSKNISSESRALLLWEARGFYAPVNATPDPWIDQWRSARRELGSWQAVTAKWKSQGYTHLVVNTSGMKFMREGDRALSAADWAAFDQLLASLPPPRQLAGQYYLLYELNQ